MLFFGEYIFLFYIRSKVLYRNQSIELSPKTKHIIIALSKEKFSTREITELNSVVKFLRKYRETANLK